MAEDVAVGGPAVDPVVGQGRGHDQGQVLAEPKYRPPLWITKVQLTNRRTGKQQWDLGQYGAWQITRQGRDTSLIQTKVCTIEGGIKSKTAVFKLLISFKAFFLIHSSFRLSFRNYMYTNKFHRRQVCPYFQWHQKLVMLCVDFLNVSPIIPYY